MKRRKPAIDGARTTTGAVVSSTLDAEPLRLRFSPLVSVQPGETTVRRVILDPPMAGLLLFIFKLNFYFWKITKK